MGWMYNLAVQGTISKNPNRLGLMFFVFLSERVIKIVLFPLYSCDFSSRWRPCCRSWLIFFFIRNPVCLHQASDFTDRLCVLWTWACWHWRFFFLIFTSSYCSLMYADCLEKIVFCILENPTLDKLYSMYWNVLIRSLLIFNFSPAIHDCKDVLNLLQTPTVA